MHDERCYGIKYMKIKEMKFNHFLGVSFGAHLLLLLLLSLFSVGSMQKKISVIEVTLVTLKVESGGSPARVPGQKISQRMFTGGGVRYPFRTESSSNVENRLQRKYNEPNYNPLSSVPSIKGDVSPSGLGKKTKLPQGAEVTAKKGPDFPSGNEASKYAGERLGVKGPLASRRVLYSEFPVYPEWAQKKGIEARVKLKFWVEPDGDVEDVFVEKKGYLQIDNLAVQSLKRWRFEPLPPGPERARQWGTIEMNFELK